MAMAMAITPPTVVTTELLANPMTLGKTEEQKRLSPEAQDIRHSPCACFRAVTRSSV
jgi:hypothetical protein